ncbi:MAG: hypothetical protein WC457_03385 [Patescibacteria group bacterium]
MKNSEQMKSPFTIYVIDLLDAYHYADIFEDERYALIGDNYTDIQDAVTLADRLFSALNYNKKTLAEWTEFDDGHDVRIYDVDNHCVYKAHEKLPKNNATITQRRITQSPNLSDNQIVEYLEKNFEEIIAQLSENHWDHFNKYFIISKKYIDKEFDNNFKRVFCNFYIMDGPHGMGETQKHIFFDLLFNEQNDINLILKILFGIVDGNRPKKLYLSFASKLIHTLDNDSPIYDNNISEILKLPQQTHTGTLDEKINNRLEIYGELRNRFNILLNNDKVIDLLIKFRKEFQQKALRENFKWQNEMLSDVKLLDSILWSLYRLIKKNRTHEQQ